MELSPYSENGTKVVAPCQEFDYGFMKTEMESPESPVRNLKESHNVSKTNIISIQNEVKKMEQKAVGIILATATKSEIDTTSERHSRHESIPSYQSESENPKLEMREAYLHISSRTKSQEKSTVNYVAKKVYRYQFDSSPPEWIGSWDGKTRKFPIPPNTSILHFAFMGGVLSRLNDSIIQDQSSHYQKPQKIKHIIVDTTEKYDGMANKEIMITPEEYKVILEQIVDSEFRHWTCNEECTSCKICNLNFGLFKWKHHCRL